MKDKIIEKANEKWREIAAYWKNFGGPAVPGAEEMELYKAATLLELSPKDKANIVILGSTPELRDMCAKHFDDRIASVTCVDATEDMFGAMSRLVKYKNPKEKYIHGNWLNLSKYFKPHSIDIVFGDHVVSNVGDHEQEFFTAITSVLKKDGSFISKIQHTDTDDKNIRPLPAYQRLKKYALALEKGEMDTKAAFTHFGLSLIFSSYYLNENEDLSLSFWGEELDKLPQQVKKGGDKYQKKILELSEKIWWKWRNVKWRQYQTAKIERMLTKYFVIKDKIPAPGHEFSRQSALYWLRVK